MDILDFLFFTRVVAVPGWVLVLQLAFDLLIYFTSDRTYAKRDWNAPVNIRNIGGRRVSKVLYVTAAITALYGIIGFIFTKHNVDVPYAFELMYDYGMFKFWKYPMIFFGLARHYRIRILIWAVIIAACGYAIKFVRKYILNGLHARSNIPEKLYNMQMIATVFGPTILLTLFGNILAEHIIGYPDAAIHAYNEGLNFVMSDHVYSGSVAIYIIFMIICRACLWYARTLSSIPESHDGKIIATFISYPACIVLTYILVRFLYTPLSLFIPGAILCCILFFMGAAGDHVIGDGKGKSYAQMVKEENDRHIKNMNEYINIGLPDKAVEYYKDLPLSAQQNLQQSDMYEMIASWDD